MLIEIIHHTYSKLNIKNLKTWQTLKHWVINW